MEYTYLSRLSRPPFGSPSASCQLSMNESRKPLDAYANGISHSMSALDDTPVRNMNAVRDNSPSKSTVELPSVPSSNMLL